LRVQAFWGSLEKLLIGNTAIMRPQCADGFALLVSLLTNVVDLDISSLEGLLAKHRAPRVCACPPYLTARGDGRALVISLADFVDDLALQTAYCYDRLFSPVLIS
jgi:hypothetical protein